MCVCVCVCVCVCASHRVSWLESGTKFCQFLRIFLLIFMREAEYSKSRRIIPTQTINELLAILCFSFVFFLSTVFLSYQYDGRVIKRLYAMKSRVRLRRFLWPSGILFGTA